MEQHPKGTKICPQWTVAASFTAEPVYDALCFWRDKLRLDAEILFAPYNQVFQELLNPGSLLSQNLSGINILLVRLEDFAGQPQKEAKEVSKELKEKLFKGKETLLLPNNLEIAHLNQYETRYLYREIFREQTYLKNNIQLQDGDVVMDIGANIGMFSLFVAQHYNDIKLYSFEPSPDTFEVLKTNLELYAPNSTPCNFGISSENTSGEFTFYPYSSVFSGFHADDAGDAEAIRTVIENTIREKDLVRDEHTIKEYARQLMESRLHKRNYTCELKSLSTIFKEYDIHRVDLLKVDAEKCEWEILMGIDDNDWEKIKQIVIEVHDTDGSLYKKICHLLEEKGFKLEAAEEKLLEGAGLGNIYGKRPETGTGGFKSRFREELEKNVRELTGILKSTSEKARVPYLLCLCPASPALENSPHQPFLTSMNRFISEELKGVSNIHVLNIHDFRHIYSFENYYDEQRDRMGHIPYTGEFFAALATAAARKIYAFTGKPYKTVILDCDNTLWKGVCGEVGPAGVEIDPAFQYLQQFIKKRHDSGMLICLASKNREEDVKRVFENRDDMILKWEHITAAKINWQRKSQNIQDLARELNLGLDSFIFIDDNPVECAEVKAGCPEVLTLQLPREDKIKEFLDHLWAFDRWEVTEDDRKRADSYKHEQKRKEFQKSIANFKDFIRELNLDIRITPARPNHYSRVSQLSIRTNQFNFTMVRRKEGDIKAILKSPGVSIDVIHVSDRFGDYGLVGVIITMEEKGALTLDTFLLSCRVLGRGVEHRIMAELGKKALEKGKKNVFVPFVPSGKNEPAKNFLMEVGAKYKKEYEENLLFRFPAKYLAKIKFIPAGSTDNRQGIGVEKKPVKTREEHITAAADKSAFFTEIAGQLQSPRHILEAIEKRSKAKSPSPGLPRRRGKPGPNPGYRRVRAAETTKFIGKKIIQGMAKILHVDEQEIQDHQEISFKELGIKSIEGIGLIAGLNNAFDIILPVTCLYDYSCPGDLAAFIFENYQEAVKKKLPADSPGVEIPSKTPQPPAAPVVSSTDAGAEPGPSAGSTLRQESRDIAVIGMSGRFPGARDIEDFREILFAGKSTVTEVPADRWDIRQHYDADPCKPNKTYCKWGGFLEDIDKFDPLFFNISGTEAMQMDPQQRLFLEESWKALEDAGYAAQSISDTKCGIFIGAGLGDYEKKMLEQGVNAEVAVFTGNHPAILASRLSYYLNLKGPSLVVETACSSSLVAVHLACKSIIGGDSDMAVAGGVFIYTTPEFHIYNSKANMLSPEGKCKTFDDSADGFVPGECAAAVVLKSLPAAEQDNDTIYGVIKASAVNQDGKTNGIMAPSSLSQTQVELEAYKRAAVNPGMISYVEAHGTGTKLGDPIEVEALTNAFRTFTDKKQYCGLGSVKTNIGHAANAAGIASLIKVLLCLRNKKYVPSLNFNRANQYINFKDSPFFVNTELKDWSKIDSGPRLAAVSSFGFSGTNCHLVIEEYDKKKPSSQIQTPCIFVLSARTEKRLKEYAKKTVDFLRKIGPSPVVEGGEARARLSLSDMAYTMQVGRQAMGERLAVPVSTIKELKEKLSRYCRGESNDADLFTGNVRAAQSISGILSAGRAGEEFIKTLIHDREFSQLAKLWVSGVDIDWKLLYPGQTPNRVPLPTYPFARQRYWIEEVPKSPDINEAAVLDPAANGRPGQEQGLPDSLDDFFFNARWIPAPLTVSREAAPAVSTAGTTRGDKQTILLFYPSAAIELARALANEYARDKVINITIGTRTKKIARHRWEIDRDDPGACDHLIGKFKQVDCIYFLGGIQLEELEPDGAEGLENSQKQGIISLFRLVKALGKHGFNRDVVQLKVITNDVHAITDGEVPSPYSSGLHGFTRSMAKEYYQWQVVLVDIGLKGYAWGSPGKEWQALAKAIAAEPAQRSDEAVALRRGVRWKRIIESITLPPLSETRLPFKKHGVYLILGGAGGIGLELGRYLAKTVQARLVLLGRSDLNGPQKQAVAQIEASGGKVLYLKADAADAESMKAAVKKAKSQLGPINGAFHSAIVLKDRTLENMDEETLRAALAPKVKGSVVLYRVLKEEPLDFIMFFSSTQSFAGSPGQANYAAGCTFKDAFAHYLNRETPYPVKIINWGYWGTVGVVASAEYNQRLASRGFRSINPEEGMEAVKRILAHPPDQVIALKANREILKELGIDRGPQVEGSLPDAVIHQLQPLSTGSHEKDLIRHQQASTALKALLPGLLLQAFREMGVFKKTGEKYFHEQFRERLGIEPRYKRLLEGLLDILARAGFIKIKDNYIHLVSEPGPPLPGEAWDSLEEKIQDLVSTFPNIRAQINLLRTCLRNYPEVLTGRKNHMEVMFPGGSPLLVENIYKGNQTADYFNHLAARAVRTYTREKLRQDSKGPVTILEVGAGTGGTSAFVLKTLREYGTRVKYFYTDISRAFTLHGKRVFSQANPFVEFKVLDIEKDPGMQDFEAGSIDLVIATNVLHATKRIDNTLTQVKKLLKTDGMLILNEVTRGLDFNTLTFGLTDGWWLYEDEVHRIDHSPLLTPGKWKQVLAANGFRKIHLLGLPHLSGDESPQNVIICESDGHIKELQHREISQPPAVTTAGTEESPRYLEEMITDILSAVLQIEQSELDPELSFQDFGVDSLLALDIAKKINEKIDQTLRSTDLFNYATIRKLSTHIVKDLGAAIEPPVNRIVKEGPVEFNDIPGEPVGPGAEKREEREEHTPSLPAVEPGDPAEEIAIIGISCQFPDARNVDEFWNNLAAGKNSSREIPETRWNIDKINGQEADRWGALLSDIDRFDPLFFNISPREAELTDPQQRLILQEAWRALEDAGYADRDLSESKCGVFIGCKSGDYSIRLREENVKPEAYFFIGNASSILPARVSYHLNLRGPAIALDTACSSSLVAVHWAYESIRSGTCQMAIAGGVEIAVTPRNHMLSATLGMASTEGQCKVFDNEADGFLSGEGLGVVVLKSFAAAARDRDHIYGIIKGSGINQDGKSNGITAPSAASQTELECEVYEKFDINPETISYVEAHGTGTILGDPIEVDALSDAFRKYTAEKQFCAIGSVKTNIGHALAAAGAAGLVKVLLAFKYKRIPPSLNFKTPNRHINFDASPFYVNTRLLDWQPKDKPRRAALSSFGFSGTNVHMVLEEAPAPDSPASIPGSSRPYYLVPLSAKTGEALKQKYLDLANWLAIQHTPQPRIGDIVFTLHMGRSHFSLRSALVVKDYNELQQVVKEIGEGEPGHAGNQHYLINDLKESKTKPGTDPALRELGKKLIAEITSAHEHGYLLSKQEYKDKLSALADLYVKGYDLDWGALYRGAGEVYRRISLPTYPFMDERYWIPGQQRAGTDSTGIRTAAPVVKLHPLLERNTSTLREQRFSNCLTGREFYLAHHVIKGQKVLPGVAYLEMARAAGELSVEQPVGKISNVIWASPIIVSGAPVEICITLLPDRDRHKVAFLVSTFDHQEERQVNMQGKLTFGAVPSGEQVDIAAVRARCPMVREGEQCYRMIRQQGINYGPGFQSIQRLYSSETEALSYLELPGMLEDGFSRYVLHPSLMDGALQTLAGMPGMHTPGTPYLPFALGEMTQLLPLTQKCRAHVTAAPLPGSKEPSIKKFNIQILDESGRVLIRMKDFSLRAFKPQTNLPEKATTGKVTRMYFHDVWQESALDASKTGSGTGENEPGCILLFDINDDAWRDLKKQAAPGPVILVKPGKSFTGKDKHMYEINPGIQEDYYRLFGELTRQNLLPGRIIHMWSTGEEAGNHETLNRQLLQGIYSLFYLSRALMEQRPTHRVRLLYVYPGREDKVYPQHAAVSAFARTIRLENPKFLYKIVEVQEQDIIKPGLLLEELESGRNHEYEVRFQGKRRLLKRMKELELRDSDKKGKPMLLREKGVYLVTGGTGALGLIFAAYLAGKVKASLVLTDLTEPDAQKQKKIEALEKMGAEVLFIKADISRRQEVEKLIEKVKSRFKQINGIIHTAGVIRDALIIKKTREEIDVVLAPKVYGTIWLDEVLEKEPLDFFVLFSSAAGVIGNIGQGDYAYANCFMDAFAGQRESLRSKQERYGSTLSIDWPLWKEGGMKVNEQKEAWLEKTFGMALLETTDGLEAFERGLRSNLSRLVFFVGERSKVLDRLGIQPGGAASGAEPRRTESHQPESLLAVNNPSGGRENIEKTLVKLLAELLKVKENDMNIDEELGDYGLDSIMMMTLLNRLEEMFGEPVAPNAVVENNTIKKLAAYLIDEGIAKAHRREEHESGGIDHEAPDIEEFLQPMHPVNEKLLPGVRGAPWHGGPIKDGFVNEDVFDNSIRTSNLRLSHLAESAAPGQKIAIIGMACRFPGANNPEQFWDILENARSMIREVPAERWAITDYYNPDKQAANKSYSKWGAFLEDIYSFDADYFGVSDEDAVIMDPQHRIMLEITEELFCRAGYSRQEVENKRIGVYLGGGESPYVKKNAAEIPGNYLKHLLVNTIQNMMAARISDYFNLKGPSHIIDTACSSALTALHQACQGIRTGECDMAITGGIDLLIGPYLHIALSKAEVLSDDGIAYVFDEGAKGFALGEGAGLVLLKSYEAALEDGDDILAVILGSAVNNDGHTMGLTVPSLEGQEEVIRQALDRSGVTADNITYLEAHGTGTLLGDPIEIKAATRVYREFTREKQYCAVGSVKSNIGHLMRAAAIPGFIKLVLALQNKVIPPTLHCSKPHPRFQFNDSPFYPIRQKKLWQPKNGIRQAAISSFGFGGTNCHVILEEFIHDSACVKKRNPLPMPQFKRKRYCLDQLIAAEPVLNEEVILNDNRHDEWALVRRFSYDEPYLRDHVIFGNRVILGVTHCSLAVEAAGTVPRISPGNNSFLIHIHKFLFLQPIVVEERETVDVAINIQEGDPGGGVEEKGNQRVFFSNYFKTSSNPIYRETTRGEYILGSQFQPSVIDTAKFIAGSDRVIPGEEINRNRVLHCPPGFRVVRRVYVCGSERLGEMIVTPEVENAARGYRVHPALLNGGFIVGVCERRDEVLLKNDDNGMWIPFMVKDMYVHHEIPRRSFCQAKLLKVDSRVLVMDISFFNEKGEELVSLKEFTFRYTSPGNFLNRETSLVEKSVSQVQAGVIESPGELGEKIKTYFTNKLTAHLGSGPVKTNRNFMELGVDSNTLIILAREIEKEIGIELYPTLFFEYQNIDEITTYFQDEHKEAFSRYLQIPPGDKNYKGGGTPDLLENPNYNVQNYKQKVSEMSLQGSQGLHGKGDAIESASLPVTSTKQLTPGSPPDQSNDGPRLTPMKSFYGGSRGAVFSKRAPLVAEGKEDIAIIGMAGRFAESPTVDAFWENLKNSKDLVREVPADRWDCRSWFDPDRQAANKTYCKWGSFIEVDRFDPAFFGISPREAVWMDPQLRLLLEVVHAAVEDAGYGRKIMGTLTGVFVGAGLREYWDEIVRAHIPIADYQANSSIFSGLSGRISFTYDLHGPSLPVDTACSSSLIGLHLAIRALRSGECDMALVSGTNLLISHLHYVYVSRMQALSPSGRCHTFDKAADGYVPGEGVGALLLKPLSGAVRDNDNIHAVIKGSAVNHVGKSNNPTSPRPELQTKVLLKAWEDAEIDPGTITYIEAHGTGTELGDPIEINALKKAFGRFTGKKGFCAIGSAKAHIGHLGAASGIAGIIKTVLSMKHKQVPVMPMFKELNPYIRLQDSPFYINRELQPWKTGPGVPRRAGVSAFGIAGANAHVVLEEYIPGEVGESVGQSVSGSAGQWVKAANIERGPVSKGPHLIILSAKDEDRLNAYTKEMVNYLERINRGDDENLSKISPGDIAYTLQVGRETMEERLAVIAVNLEELEDKLKQYLREKNQIENLYRGNEKDGKEKVKGLLEEAREDKERFIENLLENRQLGTLAQLWAWGVEIDWELLYSSGAVPRRISLPTYPFKKERYWMSLPGSPVREVTQASPVNEPGEDEKIMEILKKVKAGELESREADWLINSNRNPALAWSESE